MPSIDKNANNKMQKDIKFAIKKQKPNYKTYYNQPARPISFLKN